MKLLSQLHEEFIDNSRKPMSFGRLPVMPREADVPIVASNAWKKKDNKISKKYDFMSKQLRNRFVSELLEHEEEVGHHAKLEIEEEHVAIVLQTKDVEQVTELDKEYAKYADSVYKDVVYQGPQKKSIKPDVVKSPT